MGASGNHRIRLHCDRPYYICLPTASDGVPKRALNEATLIDPICLPCRQVPLQWGLLVVRRKLERPPVLGLALALSGRGKLCQALQLLPGRGPGAPAVVECGSSTLMTPLALKLDLYQCFMSLMFIASVFLLHIWGKY